MSEQYYAPLSDMGRIKDTLISLFGDTKEIADLVMPELEDENYSFEENWIGGNFTETMDEETTIKKLVGHCFDTSYIKDMITDTRCAIFIETNLIKVDNKHTKEVGVDIYIVCHKDLIRLSTAEKEYYNSIGIYGNRVDSIIQAIDITVNDSDVMNLLKRQYSIGDLSLVYNQPIKQYLPTDSASFYGKSLSYTFRAFY